MPADKSLLINLPGNVSVDTTHVPVCFGLVSGLFCSKIGNLLKKIWD